MPNRPSRPSRRATPAKPAPAASAKPRRTSAGAKAAPTASPSGQREALDVAILQFIRRTPNRAVELGPLAGELGVDPYQVQIEVERLHRRGMLIAPFIEPGTAGGGELTEIGLRWLIEHEGGKPSEVPVLLQPASDHVRAKDEAARLPRAQVYGVRRQT